MTSCIARSPCRRKRIGRFRWPGPIDWTASPRLPCRGATSPSPTQGCFRRRTSSSARSASALRKAPASRVPGYLGSAYREGPVPLKVFITGASSGIGAALAACYAREGAVLGLCARRAGPMQELLAGLGSGGACYAVDVTEASSLQNAARDFVERFGIPDVVIANAGVSVGTASGLPEDLAT